jgi:uncharacterized protein with ACT and thioredoxin-like domain
VSNLQIRGHNTWTGVEEFLCHGILRYLMGVFDEKGMAVTFLDKYIWRNGDQGVVN